MNTSRPAVALLVAVALASTLAGCSEDADRVSAADVATFTPRPVPVDFCAVVTDALPEGWELGEVEADPYDDEFLGVSANCSLSTGYDGDTHTTVSATWRPQSTPESAADGLDTQCKMVDVVAKGSDVVAMREEGLCQAVDDAKVPQWSLLAAMDSKRSGVILVRVDTTVAAHGKGLAQTASEFAVAAADGAVMSDQHVRRRPQK